MTNLKNYQSYAPGGCAAATKGANTIAYPVAYPCVLPCGRASITLQQHRSARAQTEATASESLAAGRLLDGEPFAVSIIATLRQLPG